MGRAVSDPSNFFDASAWRYQFCFPLIAAAPPALAYRLANLYGAFQARSHVAAQAHTVQQMRTVFADADAAQLAGYAKECYQLASRDIVDAFKFKRYGQMTDLTRVLTAQGIEPLIEHVRMGNRALLTGAHFGRFWMAGLPIVARGLTVGALTRDRMDENRSGLTQAEFAYRKKKLQVISEVFKGPFVCLGDSMREYFSAAEGLIMAMIFDGEKGPDGKYSQGYDAAMSLAVLAWIVGLIHALIVRKKVNLRIKYAKLARERLNEEANLERTIAAEYGVSLGIPDDETRPPAPSTLDVQNDEASLFKILAERESAAPVDINSADEKQIAALPGVGPILAKKAIQFRKRERPFQSIEDFARLLKLKPHVVQKLRTRVLATPGRASDKEKTRSGRVVDF